MVKYPGNKNFSQCLPLTYKCDRVQDCLDNADEKNCSYAECSKEQFTCKTQVVAQPPRVGHCVDSSKVCDGVMDCLDGSDETNCTKRICLENQWYCGLQISHNPKLCYNEKVSCDRVSITI